MRIYNKIGIAFRQLIYILVISIFLVGCGSTNGFKAPLGNNTTQNQTNTNSANNKDIKGDLELQIFVGGYGDDFWNEAIEGFKKEFPNINIIKRMGANVNQEMAPRWMSGDPPDFAFVDGPEFLDDKVLRKGGMLLDLKDWFNTSKTLDGSALIKDNIYKGFMREYEGGEIYYAPYIFGTLGMWYNSKLFKDNNLQVPTNFDEFLSLAPILKTKNIALVNYPGQYPTYLYQGFVRENLALLGGQKIFNDIDELKPGVFVSDPFYKSMYKLEVLAKTDNAFLEGTLEVNHIQAQTDWLQGKSAFIPNGMWLENEMRVSIPADFEMKFIPSLIQDKGQRYAICAYSHNLCIPQKAKNPQAAKEWLAFLYREKNLSRFTEITGIPTAYKMDLSESNVSDRGINVQKWIADPNIIIIYDEKSLDNRIGKILDDSINDVVAGRINAREACERIQQEADKVLAEKNKNR